VVPEGLRLGPRLFAQQISVPYVRIKTADQTHVSHLIPAGQRQPDLGFSSRLVGDVQCGTDDGDTTITATYVVAVHTLTLGSDLMVNIEQQYRFSTVLDSACEATHSARCKRFRPTVR
jgi:hypothetical protein